jgi:hypothetical protein
MISFSKNMRDIEVHVRGQGTILEEEKAWTTNIESDSNQRRDQPLNAAVSMAIMAPISSAFKEVLTPMLKA